MKKPSSTIVAAISGSVKIYPMNIKVDPPEGGLKRPSIVKTGRILTVSKNRLEKRLGRISAKKMKEVNIAIKLSLDFL